MHTSARHPQNHDQVPQERQTLGGHLCFQQWLVLTHATSGWLASQLLVRNPWVGEHVAGTKLVRDDAAIKVHSQAGTAPLTAVHSVPTALCNTSNNPTTETLSLAHLSPSYC